MVETDAAIICGSMPAFASFVKAYIKKPTYISSLHSRLLPQSSRPDIRSKPSTKARSFPASQPYLPQPTGSDSFRHLRDNGWLELNEVHRLKGNLEEPPTAVIRGGARSYDIEEGVITKQISVSQSSRMR